MDWKREAKEKLRSYEARKMSLKNIPDEIRRLETAFSSIRSASTDSTPVSGGGSTREDAALSNIVLRDELKRRYKEAKLWTSTVERALDTLDNEDRIVLERFYINRNGWSIEMICEELHLEKSAVYDRRDRALRRFTYALYGITES